MVENFKSLSRRAILKGSLTMTASGLVAARSALAFESQPDTPNSLAKDEYFWREIARDFDIAPGITNLENGYWGMMARPVLEQYVKHTRAVNVNTSFYARRGYNKDYSAVLKRVAEVLGACEDEILLTRGATEALQALIGGYNKLNPGDAVMHADLDYYSMKSSMDSLAAREGCSVVRLDIPEPSSYAGLIQFYKEALRKNPKVRLLLLTHIGHRTGLQIPVREITAIARAMGVDVIVDAAHSFGQLDMTLPDLNADFVGFNLHKWIGAPIGTGVMYIRRERLEDISPNPSAEKEEKKSIVGRVHTGTANFAAFLTIPAALDYHDRVGRKNMEARLRHLRDLWVDDVRNINGLDILTPDDARLHVGMTSFRFAGKTSVAANKAIVERLVDEHRIFTVHRDGVARGACVRVTPALYNSANDVQRLADALRTLSTHL